MLISLAFIFGACAHPLFFQNKADLSPVDRLLRPQDEDYAYQLSSLGGILLNDPKIKLGRLSEASENYLTSIHRKLVKNNELLLDSDLVPEFIVIRDDRPFFFSLPKAKFYFSTGYLTRFVLNEDILTANLAHEVIRSHRLIYERKMVVPTGYIELDRLLSLTRIPLESRQEVNRLSFYVLRRAGRDPSSLLNWLQLINKNSLLFSLQLGDPRLISREEFHFKNFLTRQNITEVDYVGRDFNSSAEFYSMIGEIRNL